MDIVHNYNNVVMIILCLVIQSIFLRGKISGYKITSHMMMLFLFFFETTICSIFWLHFMLHIIKFYYCIILWYSELLMNTTLYLEISIYLDIFLIWMFTTCQKLSFEKISLIATCLLIWFSIKKVFSHVEN